MLRPVEALVLPTVREALSKLTLADEDVAAARLAERYAAALDDAAGIAAEAAEIVPADDAMHARLARLERLVAPQQVLTDLGPKLLAALESLGASPKARAALTKGRQTTGGSGKLAAMRGGRAG